MHSAIVAAWHAADSTIQAAVISALATVLVGIVTVGAAIAASAIAWIGVRQQLGHDRRERGRDRSLETRREVMLDGVAGLSEAAQSIGLLVAPDVEPAEARRVLMAALSKITKASVVSSLSSAQAGRLYTETVGALFTVANSNRAFLELENKALGSQEWRHFALATVALQNSEILPLLQATLATAREDLDMGQGDTDSFRAAIAPTGMPRSRR